MRSLRIVRPAAAAAVVALALSTSGCALQSWRKVLDGMKRGSIMTELNTETQDFNASRPEGFEPAKDNKWILFVFDPAKDPDMQEAFSDLDDDCYFAELPDEDADEPDATRHTALCPYERVPPVPEGEKVTF